VHSPISSFLEPYFRPPISWLHPPQLGKYLADPFAVARDRRVYILCEEFDYSQNKGRIVGIELTDWHESTLPRVAIELPVHVSYPYLLERSGRVYCVPETSRAHEIALYEAEKLPDRWIRVATLVRNFPGSDSTVFHYQGRWWLACTNKEKFSLFIWHAQDLYGPWRPHSCNPVKTDIRSSRSAGTPFIHGSYLYRPAQDCSRTYGGRIVINRVTKLTPTEFEEQPAAVIEPYVDGPYPEGVHTVAAVGDVTIIDGKRRRLIPGALHLVPGQLRKRVTQALTHGR
jgi:hypothetical protein